jgi:TrmH family RNA methyltransferase
MLSKNTFKFIKSLQQKKFRKQENSFFVEGTKNVTELLQSDFEVTHLLFTSRFKKACERTVNSFVGDKHEVTPEILEKAGSFLSNDSALAVAKTKRNDYISINRGELVLSLDDVRDPGNLGTIISIADWYGVKKLILSEQTADFYNPKVLNASMGSFTRVSFFYTDLKIFLKEVTLPVYGAFIKGQNIHQMPIGAEGVILLGNESKGISKELIPLVTHKIAIPAFGSAESLNVAIATAVICDNFRRKGS